MKTGDNVEEDQDPNHGEDEDLTRPETLMLTPVLNSESI